MRKSKFLANAQSFFMGLMSVLFLFLGIVTFFMAFPMMMVCESTLKNYHFFAWQQLYYTYTGENIFAVNGLGVVFIAITFLLGRLSYFLFYKE